MISCNSFSKDSLKSLSKLLFSRCFPLKNVFCIEYSESQIENISQNRSGMKLKVRARAAELNDEPELFQFKANITYLIKSKAQQVGHTSLLIYCRSIGLKKIN